MKPDRVIATIVFCLYLIAVASAGGNVEQNGRIEVVPCASFNAEHARVTYVSNQPHLQFTLANISRDMVSGLTVTLTAYDKKGSVVGRQKWITRPDLPAGSKVNSTLATSLDLKSAKNFKLEFTPVDLAQGTPGCDPDKFCISCSKEARDTCGTGKVQSVTCTTGESCSCAYTRRGDVLP
jgi:hypothetical protein